MMPAVPVPTKTRPTTRYEVDRLIARKTMPAETHCQRHIVKEENTIVYLRKPIARFPIRTYQKLRVEPSIF